MMRLGARIYAPPVWTIPETIVMMTKSQVVTVDIDGDLHLYEIVEMKGCNALLWDGRKGWYVEEAI